MKLLSCLIGKVGYCYHFIYNIPERVTIPAFDISTTVINIFTLINLSACPSTPSLYDLDLNLAHSSKGTSRLPVGASFSIGFKREKTN